MFEDEIMHDYTNIKKERKLFDHTRIFSCFDENLKKPMLVIDNRYDTAIRIPFETKEEVTLASKIKANNNIEYINKLLEMFPNLEAWQPRFPCTENGDIVFVAFKNGQRVYTAKLEWNLDDNFQRCFTIDGKTYYPYETNIIQSQVSYDALEIKMGFMYRRFIRQYKKYIEK